jgi:hypothetical protein
MWENNNNQKNWVARYQEAITINPMLSLNEYLYLKLVPCNILM